MTDRMRNQNLPGRDEPPNSASPGTSDDELSELQRDDPGARRHREQTSVADDRGIGRARRGFDGDRAPDDPAGEIDDDFGFDDSSDAPDGTGHSER